MHIDCDAVASDTQLVFCIAVAGLIHSYPSLFALQAFQHLASSSFLLTELGILALGSVDKKYKEGEKSGSLTK